MSRLSRFNRSKDGVPFALTDRDVEILQALDRFRYLQTGQVHRLLFSENKTVQSARRRLRYLFHNSYIGRTELFEHAGHGSNESAYFLDKKGLEQLETDDNSPTLSRKVGKVKHTFLRHALEVSEFRLCLELALKENPIASLHRFTADFEIKSHTNKAVGRKRYKLYDEVIHPVSRKPIIVYPDALFILQGKGEYSEYKKLYFVEIDRGTEGLRVLQDKLMGYHLYQKEGIFRKFGAFHDFRLLVQTTSEKRETNLKAAYLDYQGTELAWTSRRELVSPSSILKEKIWTDFQGNPSAILK